MLTYPLHEADFGITQESIDAGKVNLAYNYKDLISMVNTAFFSGFIVAMCDSKEEFEGNQRYGPDYDDVGCDY